jgi:aldose 1-epimerase
MSGGPGGVAGAAGRLTVVGGPIAVELLPEVGGRWHRLQVDGRDLLRTPADPGAHLREPFFWGAYTMAPWCNRTAAGVARVGRRTIDLEPNFADGSAIHGQVSTRPWQVAGDGLLRIRAGGDGWPWPYEVSHELRVADNTLTIDQRLTNLADEPMPAGIGFHPWFRRPAQCAIHAELVYPTNTDSPAQPVAVSGPFDLRRLTEMASGLDATWAALAEPAVTLRWPNLGVRATMRVNAPTLHITAASPTDIDALAIEPQTHAPQGLRRLIHGEPGALALLAPAAELRQTIKMSFEFGYSDRGDGG